MKIILSEEQIKKLLLGRINEDNAGAVQAEPPYDPLKAFSDATSRIDNLLSAVSGRYAANDNDPMPNGPMAYADNKRQEYNNNLDPERTGDYESIPAVKGVKLAPISRHMKIRRGPIRYLVIHYTAGGNSKPGSAAGLQSLFNGGREASADFAVDDSTKVQLNPDPDKYYCFAVGDGGGTHNSDSISIEMCSNLKSGTNGKVPNHAGWYFTDATLSNARSLAKELMAKYNIPSSNVVRHFDMTGKLCPGVIGWNTGEVYSPDGSRTGQRNNDFEWQKFKASLG